MIDENVAALEIVRIQERASANERRLDDLTEDLKIVKSEVHGLRDIQQQCLLILERLSTTLDNLDKKMGQTDKEHEEDQKTLIKLSQAQASTAARFKLVLGILATTGTAFLALALKVLFFTGG